MECYIDTPATARFPEIIPINSKNISVRTGLPLGSGMEYSGPTIQQVYCIPVTVAIST